MKQKPSCVCNFLILLFSLMIQLHQNKTAQIITTGAVRSPSEILPKIQTLFYMKVFFLHFAYACWLEFECSWEQLLAAAETNVLILTSPTSTMAFQLALSCPRAKFSRLFMSHYWQHSIQLTQQSQLNTKKLEGPHRQTSCYTESLFVI